MAVANDVEALEDEAASFELLHRSVSTVVNVWNDGVVSNVHIELPPVTAVTLGSEMPDHAIPTLLDVR